MGLPTSTDEMSPVSALCSSTTHASFMYFFAFSISARPNPKFMSSVVSGARV